MSMTSMKLPLSKLLTVSPTAIPSSPLNDEEQLYIFHEFASVHPVPPQLLSLHDAQNQISPPLRYTFVPGLTWVTLEQMLCCCFSNLDGWVKMRMYLSQ